MKKILLSCLLMFSLFGFSQGKEIIKTYNNVTITKGSEKENYDEVVSVYYNYDGYAGIKFDFGDSTIEFVNTSKFENGETVTKQKYIYAFYKRKDTNVEAIIQIFDDEALGCRVMFDGNNAIQLY